jgi:hypothetical protein
VLAELDEEFFHVRFEKATAREREYMAAMADLGEGLRARHRQGASSATLRGAEQISGERRPRDLLYPSIGLYSRFRYTVL